MKNTRIAFKPQIPSFEVAGARLRCFLPVRYLRRAGWDCEIFQFHRLQDYQVVIFQKTYTDEDQNLARRLRARGARVVFDLCDNHLYAPPDQPELKARADQVRRMMDLCDAVTVSTSQLAKAIPHPAQVIDDALDIIRPDWEKPLRVTYRLLKSWRNPRLRLVWFGTAGMESPPFGMIDLAGVVPMLNELNKFVPLQLNVISNSYEAFHRYLKPASFPASFSPFQTRTFQKLLRRGDVCLIPVNPNPFTLCKTVNRPALSLLLGVPVVADVIPSYEELRPFVFFGNWQENLARYAADKQLRRSHVSEGQRYLETRYSAAHVVRQWSNVLEPLVGQVGECPLLQKAVQAA